MVKEPKHVNNVIKICWRVHSFLVFYNTYGYTSSPNGLKWLTKSNIHILTTAKRRSLKIGLGLPIVNLPLVFYDFITENPALNFCIFDYAQ